MMKQMVYGVVGLFVLAAGSVGGYFGWVDLQKVEPYELGDTVQNFTLNDIYGKTVSLSDYDGSEGYIIIFTCSTCPYSILYEDRIIRLAEMYADAGYPLLALNPNDPDIKPGDEVSALVQRADSLQFNFPYLVDDKEIFKRFGAEKTPEVFLLNREKVLSYRGAIDDNVHSTSGVEEKYLEQAMAALKNNEMLELQETRVTGCTIKAK